MRQDLSNVRNVLGDVLSKIHAVHDAQVNLVAQAQVQLAHRDPLAEPATAEQVRRRAAARGA